MGETATADGGRTEANYPDLTIVVDPDEIVTALQNIHEYPDRRGQQVLTVRPPFEGERRTKRRYHEKGNRWPPEMDPKPLDFSSNQFLDSRKRTSTYPTWSRVRSSLRDERGVELTDETEQEWRDEWLEVWESDVRSSFKDKIDINKFDPAPREMVPVRYESGSESE
jgi:hypothetical protein